jgi:hypothetical protein
MRHFCSACSPLEQIGRLDLVPLTAQAEADIVTRVDPRHDRHA